MTEPNKDFIIPLVKEHFKQGGTRDDGSCSEYYGTPEDFIKFARVLYEEGRDNGRDTGFSDGHDAACYENGY